MAQGPDCVGQRHCGGLAGRIEPAGVNPIIDPTLHVGGHAVTDDEHLVFQREADLLENGLEKAGSWRVTSRVPDRAYQGLIRERRGLGLGLAVAQRTCGVPERTT